MPLLPHTDTFIPERYYHIYNHAVGTDNLFSNRANYLYFLARFKVYMPCVCKCLAYCLMPNHFHFLISVRTEKEIEAFQLAYRPERMTEQPDYHKIVMNQFSRMLNGYTQAYNKMMGRKGALFIDYMKRKEVKNDRYLNNLIYYIHHNPVHHLFCKDLKDWEFSSYHSLSSSKPTGIEREEVLALFGQQQDFVHYHAQKSTGIVNEFEF